MKKKLLLVLSAVMALVALFVLFTVSASAIEIKEFNSDSYFKPVDYDTHKSVSKVTLYGNADYLCMKAYSDAANEDAFYLEVYSDSKYKKRVAYYGSTFKKGNTYKDIFFDLTGLKSGTYYAKAYVDKRSSFSGMRETDPDTIVKFKISVKKGGASSIKKMKAVMFGYENTMVGPVIYWYSIPKAEGYYVYRYDGKKYKKIGKVKATDEDLGFFIDEDYAGKNATKKYKIRAYNDEGKTDYSENNVKAYILKTPKVKAEVIGNNKVSITWKSVKESATYKVYRCTDNSDWELIETTTHTKSVDRNVRNNKIYYYTVIASTNKSVSGYDIYGAGVRFIEAPKLSEPILSENGLTLNWKAVKGADSYVVYRKTDASDKWKKLTTVNTTSFVDGNIQKNVPYYYTVKSAADGMEGSYIHNGVLGIDYDTPKLNEITYNEDGLPVLSWSPIENCSRYKVLFKDEDDEDWRMLTAIKGTKLVLSSDYALRCGQKYALTVQGFSPELNADNSDTVYTPCAESVSLTFYDKLKDLHAIPVENGISLRWRLSADADRYNIYRKTEDTEYTLIGTSDKMAYTDETVKIGEKYTYKVTYSYGDLEVVTCGAEKAFYIIENDIRLSSVKKTEIDTTSYNLYLENYDVNATYYIYELVGDKLVYRFSRKTSNGVIGEALKGENGTKCLIITSCSVDGTIKCAEDAQKNNVELFSVTGFAVTPDHAKKTLTFSWDEVIGAEKCEVICEDRVIATVKGNVATCTVKQAPSTFSKPYYIRLTKGNTCATSNTISERVLKTPVIESAKNTENNITITMKSLDSDYVIYRKEAGDSQWKELARGYGMSYADTTVKPGKTYYYTVKAMDINGNLSDCDEKGTKVTRLEPVKISSIKMSEDKITIKWQKVSGAKSYKVYRESRNGKRKLLKTVNKNTLSYVDKKATMDNVYCYSVVAVNDSSKSVRTEKGCWYTSPPKLISAKSTSKGIKIKFESIWGATRYVIYRKTDNSSWKVIKRLDGSKTSYVDRKAKKGVKYTYSVSASVGGYETPYNTKGISAKRK